MSATPDAKAEAIGPEINHVDATSATDKPEAVHADDAIRPVPRLAKGVDKAEQFLKEAGHSVSVTVGDNRRVVRLIDLRLLPILMVVYGLQSLDKGTLSYASVFGLITDANLKGTEFSWLGSVVYVAQLVFQPLVAYLLVVMPVGRFMTIMVFCWGAILCGMSAAHNFAGLMSSRLLLGIFESTVAPAFVAIVQMWYRRREQTKRNAAWYAMLGIVNILGSLLTYGLGHIQSDVLHSYQIIFLFCGLLTVIWSIVMALFMPDSPMTAKFLKGDDKLIAVERLRMNQQGVSSGVWKWDHVWDCLLDIKTWLWFSTMFIISIPSGGISTFGPLIISSFGFDSFTTILFNIPFGAIQIVATMGGAWLSDKIRMKGPVLMLLCVGPIIGCSILLSTSREADSRALNLFAYYIISFYPGISPLIYSWSGQNSAGDTKRKVTTAMLFIGSNAGNIIGPLLFTPEEKPGYRRGLLVNLIMFILLIVLFGFGMLLVKFLNRKHAAQRVALGKPEVLVDYSMSDSREVQNDDDLLNDEAAGERGFEDITDTKNEDFIYVY